MCIKKLSLCTIIGLLGAPDYLFAQAQLYDYNSGSSANIQTTKASVPAVLPKTQFTNWSSGYLGINAGFGQTNYKISDAMHLRGAVTSLGLFSGLNLQSAALVYGVAADVALPFAKKKNNKIVARR
ncbi:MAG: hypothetical protein QWI73_05285, partial [Alphaproteobacteria bacterium]|nr:hypothetical protein [Alphaproteobacteria bacterium]